MSHFKMGIESTPKITNVRITGPGPLKLDNFRHRINTNII
jgi:hypothetical protein